MSPEPTRTYAQVAASPPSTPKKQTISIEHDRPLAGRSKRTSGLQITLVQGEAEPPMTAEASTHKEALPRTHRHTEPISVGLASGIPSPTPAPSEYHFDDIDMTAFEESLIDDRRRYGTPTSEDWRNLSVHGGDSVATDIVADVVSHTVISDEVDLENFVTDGTDRFGETIPGQESAREAARVRKRQRVDGSPHDEGARRQTSIRFRKYRNRGESVAAKAVSPTTKRKQRTRMLTKHQPPTTRPSVTIEQPGWLSSSIPAPHTPRPERADKGKGVDRTSSNAAPRAKPSGTQAAAATWPSTLAEMEVDAQDDEDEEPREHEQVEILPSFMTQGRPAFGDNTPGTWQRTATSGPPVHITPATPGVDGYGFTPEPAGGFPTVHHAHPEGLIEDLAMSRVDEAWKQPEGVVLFVQVANIGHPDVPLRKPMHDEIYELIKHVTDETAFVPIAPQPEWTQPPRRPGTPKTWIVVGLSRRAATDLVRLGVLSCVWITLFFYERKLVVPRYLFTLTGYTTNHDNDIVESIRGAFMDDPIFSTIADLVQGHPTLQYLAPQEAAMRVASSVEVRVDQLGNGNMQAAVFCDSPTGSGQAWTIWRSNLMKIPFQSRYNPTAVAKRIELCAGCHSADHVTHKCPFPNIQGWNAPPPSTRTYGRPRQHGNAQSTHPPTTPTHSQQYQPPNRGRGRGTNFGRGGRNATPGRPFTFHA
ncbi:hypothetical protein C2E23DRAFT_857167 [Lenzites betulinus]|nr:hypothetical protein C2E23DRAFT_857167 [Lenzites betulinus]